MRSAEGGQLTNAERAASRTELDDDKWYAETRGMTVKQRFHSTSKFGNTCVHPPLPRPPRACGQPHDGALTRVHVPACRPGGHHSAVGHDADAGYKIFRS